MADSVDNTGKRLTKGFYYVEVEQPDVNKIVFDIDYYDGEKFIFNKVKHAQIRVDDYETFVCKSVNLDLLNDTIKKYYGSVEEWMKVLNGRRNK